LKDRQTSSNAADIIAVMIS